MALLRRLPTPLLVALALGWFAAGELVTFALAPPGASAHGAAALLLAPGRAGPAAIAYPRSRGSR